MSITIPSSCKAYDFGHSIMWLNNSILCAKYKMDLVIDIDLAKQMVSDRLTFSGGIIRPYLVDITGLLSVDSESRNYLAGPAGCQLISAGGIVTKNKLLAFIGNTFILIDRPLIPAKVFSSETNAVRWLEPFKNQN